MNTPVPANATRVWDTGPQPGRDVDTVRDIDGDIWERWMADIGEHADIWAVPHSPDMPMEWDELAEVFGPLVDATGNVSGDAA